MTTDMPAGEAIDDNLVPLSALQHYLFCPRQCGLIHVERLWLENAATAEGRLLHERVDGGRPDRHRGVRTVRGLYLQSRALGLAGKADAVEFHRIDEHEQPYPVEYKRGRPKAHRADEVQICAQALCLEEMFGVTILEGALYYGQTRRRTIVRFDADLRDLTASVASATRSMILSQQTPAPRKTPACKSCSLIDRCCPGRLEHPPGVARWLTSQVAD